MALDMVTIPVAIKVPGGLGYGTANLESELMLADIMPDISRILMSELEVFGVDAEIMPGKVKISGNVHANVLYASTMAEQPVRSATLVIPFSFDIMVDGAMPGMMIENAVKAMITDVKALNARKMLLKFVVEAFVRAFDNKERNLVSDIDGIEGVQTLRSQIVIPTYAGKAEGTFTIEGNHELAASKTPIWEVLLSKVNIKNTSIRQSAGYAEINGDVNVSVIYTEDDQAGNLQTVDFTFPLNGVTRTEEIEGANDLNLKTTVLAKRVEASEDETGELKKINVELDIQAEVDGYGEQEFSMIDDAFGPGMPMVVKQDSLVTESIKFDVEGGFSVSATIPVEDPMPEVDSVITTVGKIKNSQITAGDRRVKISGIADFRVIYNGKDESGVRGVSYEIPFERDVDVNDAAEDDKLSLKLSIGNCLSSSLSSTSLDARMDLSYNVKSLTTNSLSFTENIVAGEMQESRNNDEIIVYMAAGGETPWDVAKKYLVTLDEVIGANGIPIQNTLSYGEKVIIFD